MPDFDQEVVAEINTIPLGRRKAYVYNAKNNTILARNSIHAVIASELGVGSVCAGFLERTADAIWVIHWPESPVDACGGGQYLPKIVQKLKDLGFRNVAIRRAP